jgi:hypothetical protein
MAEWWTYRPSDFLMFSPRVYARLIETVNAEAWPLQCIGALASAGLLVLLLRRDAWGPRAALRVLAFAWLSVALFFHARHFSTINTAAPFFAWAFGAQSLLLLGLTGWVSRLTWADAGAPRRAVGCLLAATALLYPLAAPLVDRPWRQAECFGVLPNPTVVATLAVLLLVRLPRGLGPLAFVLPLLWCVVAMLLHWTLHEAGGVG